MGRSPRRNPSFFKVLIGDFINKLRIPPAFTRKYFRGITFDIAILKTAGTGKSWRVKMKQEDSYYFFNGGWRKFVEDQRLEAGDFLVFCFHGDSTFQVAAYDKSGCEKAPNLGRDDASPVPMEGEGELGGANKVALSIGTEQPQFVKVLKKYHDYGMVVPKDFAVGSGLIWYKSTLVRDPEGREWAVKVCKRGRGKTELSSGWSNFVKANKLGDGDTCLFKGIHETPTGLVIQVEILGRAAIPQIKIQI